MLESYRLVHAIPLLLAAAAFPRTAGASAPTAIQGFRSERLEWEQRFEELFKSIPSATQAARLVDDLSSHPTLVATDWSERNLQYLVRYLRGMGLAPETRTYYPYISTPRQVQVDLVAPFQHRLAVKELGWPWQEHFEDGVIGYNAYTPVGEITADLVYVNYGLAADYERLAQFGIDVRGKIVIARYGRTYRGVKNRLAYEHGAAGLLLYDDPNEDGFVQGDVYPTGPWRSPDGIQRGSIQQIFKYPGDPLTPGWAATEHAYRLAPCEADNLPGGTPTTPIGYGDAAYLLESLDGPVAPAEWQGGLSDPQWASFGRTPFTYHLGGTGNTKVHMNIDVEYSTRAIRNIIVGIPGVRYPDQVVLIGAHRDGWVYGTADNTASLVAVLETTRALKLLADQGWQPDRTILVAAWEGEEYGMLGSTEWGEEFQQPLARHLVGYINIDAGGGSAHFYAAGVPALDDLVYDVSRQVTVTGRGQSVYDDWVEQSGGEVPMVDREGSGSDFAVFLDFLGVPVVDLGFYSDNGNYHSSQDDLLSVSRWGDPGFTHLVGTAQLAGIAALRLANADVLPLTYSRYAEEVGQYLEHLEMTFPQSPVPLDRLKTQAEEWKATALAFESKVDALMSCARSAPRSLERVLREANEHLISVERHLTHPKGLPQRPWHKHMIYGPDWDTGYAVEYLPALHDTLAAGDWKAARHYAHIVRESLAAATQALQSAVPDSARCRAAGVVGASTRHPRAPFPRFSKPGHSRLRSP